MEPMHSYATSTSTPTPMPVSGVCACASTNRLKLARTNASHLAAQVGAIGASSRCRQGGSSAGDHTFFCGLFIRRRFPPPISSWQSATAVQSRYSSMVLCCVVRLLCTPNSEQPACVQSTRTAVCSVRSTYVRQSTRTDISGMYILFCCRCTSVCIILVGKWYTHLRVLYV